MVFAIVKAVGTCVKTRQKWSFSRPTGFQLRVLVALVSQGKQLGLQYISWWACAQCTYYIYTKICMCIMCLYIFTKQAVRKISILIVKGSCSILWKAFKHCFSKTINFCFRFNILVTNCTGKAACQKILWVLYRSLFLFFNYKIHYLFTFYW